MNIGPVPYEEKCLPNTDPGSRREVEIFCRQLRRQFPKGSFTVEKFDHDFGPYYEVVAAMDTSEQQEAAEAAQNIKRWDAISLRDMRPDTQLDEYEYASSIPDDQLEAMVLGFEDCVCVDGCEVEPDGQCPHGYRSPLLIMGLI